MNGTNLIGLNPLLKINEIQDGGAIFSPLRADMLRTIHSKPQVVKF